MQVRRSSLIFGIGSARLMVFLPAHFNKVRISTASNEGLEAIVPLPMASIALIRL